MTIWKNSGLLSNTKLDQIQHEVDSINLTAGIGRVPGKIAAAFSNFTAEQCKTGQSYFPAIFSKLDYLKNTFKHGVYLLKQSHVEKSDILLLQFCKKFEILYGKEKCTPNMHMHCHLKYSILDVGPLYSFWCFR